MNNEQKTFMDNYIFGTIEQFEEILLDERYNLHNNRDIILQTDYIDEIEDALKDNDIVYTSQELQEMLDYFIQQMKKEYGDNIHLGNESIVPLNGNFKISHSQLAIAVYA